MEMAIKTKRFGVLKKSVDHSMAEIMGRYREQ